MQGDERWCAWLRPPDARVWLHPIVCSSSADCSLLPRRSEVRQERDPSSGGAFRFCGYQLMSRRVAEADACVINCPAGKYLYGGAVAGSWALGREKWGCHTCGRANMFHDPKQTRHHFRTDVRSDWREPAASRPKSGAKTDAGADANTSAKDCRVEAAGPEGNRVGGLDSMHGGRTCTIQHRRQGVFATPYQLPSKPTPFRTTYTITKPPHSTTLPSIFLTALRKRR
jgi:hypothetical protein